MVSCLDLGMFILRFLVFGPLMVTADATARPELWDDGMKGMPVFLR